MAPGAQDRSVWPVVTLANITHHEADLRDERGRNVTEMVSGMSVTGYLPS